MRAQATGTEPGTWALFVVRTGGWAGVPCRCPYVGVGVVNRMAEIGVTVIHAIE